MNRPIPSPPSRPMTPSTSTPTPTLHPTTPALHPITTGTAWTDEGTAWTDETPRGRNSGETPHSVDSDGAVWAVAAPRDLTTESSTDSAPTTFYDEEDLDATCDNNTEPPFTSALSPIKTEGELDESGLF